MMVKLEKLRAKGKKNCFCKNWDGKKGGSFLGTTKGVFLIEKGCIFLKICSPGKN
jgi:hypothetical protein